MGPVPAGLLAITLAFSVACARPDWIEQTLVTVDVSGEWRGTTTGTQGGAGNVDVWLVEMIRKLLPETDKVT